MEREGGSVATSPVREAVSSPGTAVTVGSTMRLKGEICSDEELYLDGEIEGTVEVRHCVTIGPNGKVKARVTARDLVVWGSIQGDVEASGRIAIMTGASIVGDVKTAGIVIEDGAYFKGGIDILHPENKLKETSASAHSITASSQVQGG